MVKRVWLVVSIALSIGFLSVTAFIDRSDLTGLQDLIVRAKHLLDSAG